tara:strand:- start:67 stop:324 length:258 start_codon:yes stop_codon:yes gene_type:complete
MVIKQPIQLNKMLKKISVLPFLLLIRIYQSLISPLLGPSCRFTPTCSQYSKEALKKHGLFKGLYLTLIRLSNCHPWGKSGHDPVP